MMKYSGNFITIVIISSISGIFFAVLDNDLTIDHPKNYFLQKNDNSFQDQSKENKNLENTKNEIEEEYKKSEKKTIKISKKKVKKSIMKKRKIQMRIKKKSLKELKILIFINIKKMEKL